MAASRQETLRQIEKLLGQGRLDAAIAKYAQIVEQHPNDWATANALGEALEAVGETARALAVLLELQTEAGE